MTFKVVSEGGLKLSTMGLFGFQTFLGSPSSQRLISYILSYAFDKTIKRDAKCFEKSFLASVHPRLICYELLLIFSEMNFSGSHFRWYCITHVLFNSFQTNIGFYSQHKKWSFRLRISSINVTKSSGDCGSGFIFTKENLIPKKIFSFIGCTLAELFRKPDNWWQSYKQTSSTSYTSNDVLRRKNY